jgi:hypothetical protein
LGLATLDRPPPAGSSRPLAWFVAAFRLANAVFTVAVVAALPWRVYGLVGRLAALAGHDPAGPVVRGAALLACAFLAAGLGWSARHRLRSLAGRQ